MIVKNSAPEIIGKVTLTNRRTGPAPSRSAAS
jgi:hypothetical protein